MFKWGINLLFVVFAELLFVMYAEHFCRIKFMSGLMGGPLIIVVVIFLIEFTVAGTLIYKGYIQSINKK